MSSIKFAFRTLFKTPFVTVIAIVSLALGIGANAAIFSCFNQMLLQALTVPGPEQLVNLSAPGPNLVRPEAPVDRSAPPPTGRPASS